MSDHLKFAKWGILGGTFDPIHLGHIKLAKKAQIEYQLDKIIFIPAGIPYHRPIEKQPKASSQQRYEMTQLAIQSYADFSVDDCEILRKSTSYTYDTVCELKNKYPNVDFHLILGQDSFHTIHTWHNYLILLNLCKIIVAHRKTEDCSPFDIKIPHFELEFNEAISATFIRKLIQNQQLNLLENYLPRSVINYIFQHKIY